MPTYSDLAGRPGHRCGQCRYFNIVESPSPTGGTKVETLCCIVPPKPGQTHGYTEPQLFCPAWEPTHPPKAGCKLDLTASPEWHSTHGTYPEVSPNQVVGSVKAGRAEFTVERMTFTLSVANSLDTHADNCPCREKP